MTTTSLLPAIALTVIGLALLATGAIHALRPEPLRRFHAAAARVTRPLLTARATALGLCFAGLALVATGAAAVRDYDPIPPLGLRSAANLTPQFGLIEDTTLRAKTDRGRAIVVRKPSSLRDAATLYALERRFLGVRFQDERLLRDAPADDASNCFGWVFSGGRGWLDPDQVEAIIVDNGYRSTRYPRPGDIAVYRDSDRKPSHVAVVRAAGADGVLVAGKWGWMGAFTHRATETDYGSDFVYYRSPRTNHILAGLPVPPASAAGAPIRARPSRLPPRGWQPPSPPSKGHGNPPASSGDDRVKPWPLVPNNV